MTEISLFRLHNKNSFPSKLGPTNVCFLTFKTVNLWNLFFYDLFHSTDQWTNLEFKSGSRSPFDFGWRHFKISVYDVYKFLCEVVYLFCNKINSWERKEQGSIETSEKRVHGEGRGGARIWFVNCFRVTLTWERRAAGSGTTVWRPDYSPASFPNVASHTTPLTYYKCR